MNNNNAKRSRSRKSAQTVPDDVYGTMRNTTNYSSAVNSQNDSAESIRMAREARESAGTTPPESSLNQMNQTNQANMDADPRQAAARAMKNNTKYPR